MVLVQEALCGDLLRFMYRKYGGRLPERVAVSLVLRPLLRALDHLHSKVGVWRQHGHLGCSHGQLQKDRQPRLHT